MKKRFCLSSRSIISAKFFVALGIILSLMAFAIIDAIKPSEADAADLIVNRTGVNQFGAASAQLTATAALNADTFTSGNQNIILKSTYKYTAADVANGVMIADKAMHDYVTFAGVLQANSTSTGEAEVYVMYNGGIAANSSVTINDAFKMRYPGRVVDADNNTYDLMLYFRSVKIENRANRAITKPVGLFNGRSLSAWTSLQEAANQQEINNRSSINSSIIRNHGVEMTVEAKVVNPGTETPVSGKLIPFRWTDLDVYDFNSSNRQDWTGPYVESIMLASGIYGNTYVESNTLLNVIGSTYGNNTWYRATASDDNTVRSGVGYLANSASSTFVWRGRDCATSMGALQTSKVTTSTYGDYASKATIDSSDNAVLWKENKTVNMSAMSGYYIDEIKVDGTIVYSGTDQTKTSHQYTLNSVTTNHTVAVSVARKTGSTTIHHYIENTSSKLYDDTIVNGFAGDSFNCADYVQTSKTKYENSSLPAASACVIGENGYSINYYYRKKSGVIHVFYIDQDNGAQLGTQDFSGAVDNTVTITARGFSRYLLVTEPEEVTLTYTVDEQNVIFNYRKLWRITTRYVDYDNSGNPIAEDKISESFAGEAYRSSPIEIEQYKLFQAPETDTYTFGGEDQVIVYYYRPRATIKIRYIDMDGNDIRPAYFDNDGFDGDAGVCEVLEFPEYELIEAIDPTDCVYHLDGRELNVRYRKKKPAPKPSENPTTSDTNPLPNIAILSSLGLVTGLLLMKLLKRR
ncbi:MucBP domain-containing protein [Candidatus Saccharibacteria bacterium]|nr:MucBP domain-containing protein [Candidatus Saccharibacteria bacterium]